MSGLIILGVRLSGPISRDIAMLSLRYPLSHDTFSAIPAIPQQGAIPPFGALFYTDISVRYPMLQHIAQYLCDTYSWSNHVGFVHLKGQDPPQIVLSKIFIQMVDSYLRRWWLEISEVSCFEELLCCCTRRLCAWLSSKEACSCLRDPPFPPFLFSASAMG